MTASLGIFELSSIARAIVVSDALVKRACVQLWLSRPVSSGKHVIAFGGEVAEVQESMVAGYEAAGDALIDRLYLSGVHGQVVPLVRGGQAARPSLDAVGVVETSTVCAAVLAADAAAKAAEVTLLEMQLAVGIGGKAFFTMTGELYSVEAAIDAAVQLVGGARLIGTEIIAAPHEDLHDRLIF